MSVAMTPSRKVLWGTRVAMAAAWWLEVDSLAGRFWLWANWGRDWMGVEEVLRLFVYTGLAMVVTAWVTWRLRHEIFPASRRWRYAIAVAALLGVVLLWGSTAITYSDPI